MVAKDEYLSRLAFSLNSFICLSCTPLSLSFLSLSRSPLSVSSRSTLYYLSLHALAFYSLSLSLSRPSSCSPLENPLFSGSCHTSPRNLWTPMNVRDPIIATASGKRERLVWRTARIDESPLTTERRWRPTSPRRPSRVPRSRRDRRPRPAREAELSVSPSGCVRNTQPTRESSRTSSEGRM